MFGILTEELVPKAGSPADRGSNAADSIRKALVTPFEAFKSKPRGGDVLSWVIPPTAIGAYSGTHL